MTTNAIIQKYVSVCKNYGVDINVELVHGTDFAHKTDGNTITLNLDKIPESRFEVFLAYDVRKVLLPQLVLTTERLVLRPFRKTDADDCFAFLSDKKTCHDDGGYEPFTEMNEEYRALMDKFAEQPLRKMIALKDAGKVIGTINIMDVTDRVVQTYELGYVISPEYRCKGYAYEATSTLCECLLDELHLDMIISGAIEDNASSHSLLKKLGFEFEGRKTKAFYHPEHGAIDLLYYVKER